jgi:hypothetical protein
MCPKNLSHTYLLPNQSQIMVQNFPTRCGDRAGHITSAHLWARAFLLTVFTLVFLVVTSRDILGLAEGIAVALDPGTPGLGVDAVCLDFLAIPALQTMTFLVVISTLASCSQAEPWFDIAVPRLNLDVGLKIKVKNKTRS